MQQKYWATLPDGCEVNIYTDTEHAATDEHLFSLTFKTEKEAEAFSDFFNELVGF